MLALFSSYSLLQLVQEALASGRITIARPGGILYLGYSSSGSFAPYLSSWARKAVTGFGSNSSNNKREPRLI